MPAIQLSRHLSPDYVEGFHIFDNHNEYFSIISQTVETFIIFV